MSEQAIRFGDKQVFLLTGFNGAEPTSDNAKVFGSYGDTVEDAIARVLAANPNFQLSGALSLDELREHVDFLEKIQAGANLSAPEGHGAADASAEA
jgi:hypothetical protein